MGGARAARRRHDRLAVRGATLELGDDPLRIDLSGRTLLDVPDNETLHRLMNEWAEIIPATFEVYPVIDPGPAKAYLKKTKK